MKTSSSKRFLTLLLSGAMAALAPQWAEASTAPCTPIDNTATVAYKVGAVDQTPKDSNTATFNVGVKVMVNLTTNDSAHVPVTPGTTPAVLKFTITNNGNAVHDYTLGYTAFGAVAAPWGSTDSFDGTTIAIYLENGTTVGFQSTEDTLTSTIDGLAADGGEQIAYIVYTPSDLTQANNAIAAYYLNATSKWADGSAIISGSGTPTLAQAGGVCDGSTTVDVVFGDDDGPNDGDRDGIDSDASDFQVSTATIGVTKGYSVVSDPINGAGPSAKAIPGAVVRYTIAIENTGGSSAVLSTISDTLAGTLQVVTTAGNATWAVPASSRAVTSGTLTVDTADANADGLGHTDTANPAGDLTATLATILVADIPNSYAAGELKSGETITLTFDATIQ